MTINDIIDNPISGWMEGNGTDSDIVISSRIRLARNLKNIPFPSYMQATQAEDVISVVGKAVKGSEKELELILLETLPANYRQILVEKHLISPQHTQTNIARGLLVNKDQTISIMVNEEDHLRIQCLLPGLELAEAWERANEIDDFLESQLDIAYCEDKGYLTACPTNVGTGLRASVMLHLPALGLVRQRDKIFKAISQVGMTVRGLYGEGSEGSGNLFQISNQITIGLTETEIINNLIGVTKQIVTQERDARKQLLELNKEWVMDRISRSLGLLAFAHIMNSDEAINLLSNLRMGLDLNLVKDIDVRTLNELLIITRPAYLQKLANQVLTPEERDIKRGAIIKGKLKICQDNIGGVDSVR